MSHWDSIEVFSTCIKTESIRDKATHNSLNAISSYNYEETSKMKKVKMGVKPLIYPVPVILLGANVDGKPN